MTLTSPLGLHADISPPLDRTGGPPIKVSSKPRVPRPIYDTFKSRLCCKQVTKSYTSLLPPLFYYHCPVIAAVQQSHSHCLVYLLFGASSVHSSEAVCCKASSEGNMSYAKSLTAHNKMIFTLKVLESSKVQINVVNSCGVF